MAVRGGHSVLSVSRPALLRPDARKGGAEAPVERAKAARANGSAPLFAEVTGVPNARYLDCLHFCQQGVPAFYALAVFRFVVLRGARYDHFEIFSRRAVLTRNCVRYVGKLSTLANGTFRTFSVVFVLIPSRRASFACFVRSDKGESSRTKLAR